MPDEAQSALPRVSVLVPVGGDAPGGGLWEAAGWVATTELTMMRLGGEAGGRRASDYAPTPRYYAAAAFDSE